MTKPECDRGIVTEEFFILLCPKLLCKMPIGRLFMDVALDV
jgi:hypothetical protein